MPIDPLDQGLSSVAQLPSNREDTDRCTLIKRLEAGSCVCMPEDPSSDLPWLPSRTASNPVQSPLDLDNLAFVTGYKWRQ